MAYDYTLQQMLGIGFVIMSPLLGLGFLFHVDDDILRDYEY